MITEGSYTDDFSDPNSGWEIKDDDVFTIGYRDGEYEIAMKETTKIASPKKVNRLQCVQGNGRIQLYVNDQLLREVEFTAKADTEYEVGFFVGGTRTAYPPTVRVDNFAVTFAGN